MIRCLVTGGSGFVGRYAVSALRESGRETLMLSRTELCDKVIAGDLNSKINLGSNCFDEVYHIAGLAHCIPGRHRAGADFFKVNVEGTRFLLDGLEKTGNLPQSFVFISSVSVYGADRGVFLDEETSRGAMDPYGASKKEAEDLLLSWGAQHNVRIGIARLPLVVGPNAPGNLGAMIKALKANRYLGIGDGAARRSMVCVDQVASILPKIAEIGGVYHLTDGHNPSFAELEAALCSEIGRQLPMRLPLWIAKIAATCGDALGENSPINTRVVSKMTDTLTFSDDRAQNMLGWEPVGVLDKSNFLFDD